MKNKHKDILYAGRKKGNNNVSILVRVNIEKPTMSLTILNLWADRPAFPWLKHWFNIFFLFLFSIDYSSHAIQFNTKCRVKFSSPNRIDVPVIIGVFTVTWLTHHLLKVAWRSIAYMSTYYILYCHHHGAQHSNFAKTTTKTNHVWYPGKTRWPNDRPTDRPVPDLKYGLAGHKTPGTDGARVNL